MLGRIFRKDMESSLLPVKQESGLRKSRKRSLRKGAAVILAAALMMQSCMTGLAEESSPEMTQTETQAAQTETQAAQTETQAAQTETQATQTETQAAQTETQAAQTETQAAQTETQAAQTETQAAQTETQAAQTETQTEETKKENKKSKKKKKKETEETEETERSERVNSGEKVKASALTSKLSKALPYLFAASSVTAPETLLEGQEIIEGAEGSSIVSGLKAYSVTLANAKSSSGVEVINIYADEKGTLDTAQLDKLFANHTIDVSKKYYVINIIADSPNQALSFSGYAMISSGGTVTYEDTSEPGDILYNFAALEDGELTGYRGTVTLSASGGLQGTYLAPEADVRVSSDLAGAVYANAVTVADSVEELLQIVFVNGRSAETKTAGETAFAETEGGTETAAETAAEAEPENDTETAAEAEPENDTETAAEAEPENDTEITAQSETQTWADVVVETETDTEPETQVETADSEVETAEDVRTLEEGEPIDEEDASEAESGDMMTENENSGKGVLNVSVQAFYNNVLLTAEESMAQELYLSLFSDSALTERKGTVRAAFAADAQTSDQVSFTGLAEGTYYLAATDEQGAVLSGQVLTVEDAGVSGSDSAAGSQGASQADSAADTQEASQADSTIVSEGVSEADSAASITVSGEEARTVSLQYSYLDYPEGSFYYTAEVRLTKKVLDYDGSELATSESFYVSLYSDEERTQRIDNTPAVISMNGAASASASVLVKMTAGSEVLYLAETDSEGNALTENFAYSVTYPDAPNGSFIVNCQAEEGTNTQAAAAVTIQNKKNDTVVKLRVVDDSGKNLSGATLVLKNKNGNVVSVNNTVAYTSDPSDIVLTNVLTEGETYYLSEVTAPSGYTAVPDVKFTVSAGNTTVAELVNAKTVSTDYSLAVTKQVYSGNYQVYAQDTSSGTYAAEGRYTFYVALFSNKTLTKKVSDVKAVTVSGLGGTVTFSNLTQGATYYVAETDQYGEVLSSTSTRTIRYTDSGKVTMSSKTQTTMIQNVYSSLPKGYRYTGTLTITMNVVNASGTAENVTDTFYVGIYRKSDYSDKPTVIPMSLSNASTASVKRRILLSGSSNVTYYIAEVDSGGTRITDSSGFDYTVSVSETPVTISPGTDAFVTVTNKKTSSKATLYITKRVYSGSMETAVNETFYAGLFKDAEFTQLYTNPIPLTLDNKSEVTLKLTLNIGTSGSATVYVAEVDSQGNLITDEEGFGYNIRMVNSTAAFTQDNLEVQTVLINSVYGTTSSDDWNNIISSGGFNSGAVVSNGTASASPVATGDETPVVRYLILLAAALVVFTGSVRRRRKSR